MAKDLLSAHEEAARFGLALETATSALALFQRAIADGHGGPRFCGSHRAPAPHSSVMGKPGRIASQRHTASLGSGRPLVGRFYGVLNAL